MIKSTISGHYTQEDLENYARYRKERAIENIQTVLNDSKVTNGDIAPEEHEEYWEPLSIGKETIVEIMLSWGGDADGYKLTFDKDNELVRGVYYWADWGVYEEVSLSDEEIECVDNLYVVSEWLKSY